MKFMARRIGSRERDVVVEMRDMGINDTGTEYSSVFKFDGHAVTVIVPFKAALSAGLRFAHDTVVMGEAGIDISDYKEI